MAGARINDAYMLYCLADMDIARTLKLTKVSRGTLNKYITIKERLDMTLFEYMDKKGGSKLTLDMALYICKNVLNPEYQGHILDQIIGLKKPDMIRQIRELSTCVICADQSANFEETPCCNQFLCEGCLIRVAEAAIEDLTFKPINCPFCQQSFTLNEVKDLMIRNYRPKKKNPMWMWKSTGDYYRSLTFGQTYARNLYQKFMGILGAIEFSMGLVDVGDTMQLNTRDYSPFSEKGLYYGCCTSCSPDMSRNRDIDFRGIRISSVEKQCIMGENELAVLEPRQFLCVVCKSLTEDPTDTEFKKCPHCGIRTLKPAGCNYVRCGDHRWCFVCEERLENTSNGHNVHYYTGLPGASPYESACRVSLQQFNKPTFVLKTCDCSACVGHQGAPLCRELECMNRVPDTEGSQSQYCDKCAKNRELVSLVSFYDTRDTRDNRLRYVNEPYVAQYYGLHKKSLMKCFGNVIRKKKRHRVINIS